MDTLVVIFVVVAIPASFYIGWFVRGQAERIKRLEQLVHSRLTYKAREGIEDLEAVLIDAAIAGVRIKKAYEIARAIRAGEYDPESPAGKREVPHV